ncbi:MAG: hypothetical protein ACI4DT_06780 [Chordicoccus sp.]
MIGIPSEITGIIMQGDTKGVFVGQDHRFLILPTNNSVGSMIDIEDDAEKQEKIIPKNDFLRGETFTGYQILIYCPNEIELMPTGEFDTWFFALSNVQVDRIDGIRFVGGSLNSVFSKESSQQLDVDCSGRCDRSYCDNKTVIPIGTDDVKEIQVYADPYEENLQKGDNAAKNNKVILDLIFEKSLAIDDGIKKHYNDVITLLQFLTFRRDAEIEYMELLQRGECYSGAQTFEPIATCDVKNENDLDSRHGDLYSKVRNHIHCIRLDSLTHEAVQKLYQDIANQDTKHSKLSIDFIPNTRFDVPFLTKQQIRDICTAVEVETRVSEIKAAHEAEFAKLIKEFKNLIKQSKNSEFPLSDREYEYINGSIQHLVGPAVELAKKLYDRHKVNVSPLLKYYRINDISEDDIHGVIKARNNLTHRGIVDVDERTIVTACILMGVIYSSILTRCGDSVEHIQSYFQQGLLTETEIVRTHVPICKN